MESNMNMSNNYENMPNNAINYDLRDLLIVVLVIVLVLSILGINIFYLIGHLFQYIGYLVKPLFSILGYTSGSVINTTSELAADTSHFGIDIANGTAHDIGNLLLAASDKRDLPTLPPAAKTYPSAILNAIGSTLNIRATPVGAAVAYPAPPIITPSPVPSGPSPAITIHPPSADTTESPIQNPISTNKSQWCLVGEYQQRNGCIEVDDIHKCMSGQTFPNQQMCLNSSMNTGSLPTNYGSKTGIPTPQIIYK